MSIYVVGTPMEGVIRCATEHGTHIEPPLDPAWSPFDRMRWLLAVVEVDSGLKLKVAHFTDSDTYGISGHGHNLGATTYAAAWRSISDISLGAQMAHESCPTRAYGEPA